MPVPPIDHVVIDVGDRLDEAARRYHTLGFNLTARAYHSLGSCNQLAMLDPDYIELLSPGNGARPELAGFPVGLNGLVFAMREAESVHDELRGRGAPVLPVRHFSRAVDLPDGQRREARFKTVRVEPRTVFDGRLYFCEHLTPELVWRPEWQAHPNGALGLARIALSARNPDDVAAAFDHIFGGGAVGRATGEDRPHILRAGKVGAEIWPQAALARALGRAMPESAGRADHMALLGIRVRSLRQTAQTLRGNGIGMVEVGADRILVPAIEAMNVAVEFVE
jgi:hypothetical protein